MKRKLLTILVVIVMFVSGYFVLNEFQKKHLVSEAQENTKKYVIENYEDIESVQVSTDNYNFKPMGTLGIGGHINNTDHLTFYITFLIVDNEVGEVISIVEAPDFPPEKDVEKKDE